MSALTHFDAQGQAHMVDVAAKPATHRIALATGRIEMLPATLALIEAGNAKKGDVLGIARIAGIQGAKKTSDLIPLCHPLALTRQNLPTYDRSAPGMGAADGVQKGGYVLFERADDGLQVILIGTGSEVDIAYQAALKLADAGIGVRVVSLPSWELFEQQDEAYRAAVLPPNVPKVSVEAATTFGWARWVGNDPRKGIAIGIDHFGASAPFQRLYQEFGLTVDNVIATAQRLI